MGSYLKDIGRYYWLILRISVEHADRWDFVIVFILALVVLIAGFIGWKINPTSLWWLWSVIGAILFDFIIIIPARIGVRYMRITTPKLRVELESAPQNINNNIWWNLRVYNDCNVNIEDCYGQVMSLVPNKNPTAYPGMNLAWSGYGSTNTKTVTIPAKSSKLLDVIMTDRKSIYIVSLSPKPGIRSMNFPEPPGTYNARIQVGSERISFKPTIIGIEIVLDNVGNLDVKEVK